MIDRRRFTLGLATCLWAPAAAADVRINGVVMPEPSPIPKKDIPYTPVDMIPNHRRFMREIVIELANYGHKRKDGFIVLLRNAPELVVKERREEEWERARDPEGFGAGKYPPEGALFKPCLEAIDGFLLDGLFYGRDKANTPTMPAMSDYLLRFTRQMAAEQRRSFSIEYCSDAKANAGIMAKAAKANLLSVVLADPDLATLPAGRAPQENPGHVDGLKKVQNFLPMFKPGPLKDRAAWIAALADTNYDMLVIDPFWPERNSFTLAETKQLTYKQLGTRRLVIARLPLGRAMADRFYWQDDWRTAPPPWLAGKDDDHPGQYHVKYWQSDWKDILSRYMQGLMDLGVDGVLLDAADEYLYLEEITPLE